MSRLCYYAEYLKSSKSIIQLCSLRECLKSTQLYCVLNLINSHVDYFQFKCSSVDSSDSLANRDLRSLTRKSVSTVAPEGGLTAQRSTTHKRPMSCCSRSRSSSLTALNAKKNKNNLPLYDRTCTYS